MILLGNAQCFKKNCDWPIKMPYHIIFSHVVNVINTTTLLQFFFPILPLAFLFQLGIPKHILGPCYKCFGHVKVLKGYVNWYLACYVNLCTCYLACYTCKFFFQNHLIIKLLFFVLNTGFILQ